MATKCSRLQISVAHVKRLLLHGVHVCPSRHRTDPCLHARTSEPRTSVPFTTLLSRLFSQITPKINHATFDPERIFVRDSALLLNGKVTFGSLPHTFETLPRKRYSQGAKRPPGGFAVQRLESPRSFHKRQNDATTLPQNEFQINYSLSKCEIEVRNRDATISRLIKSTCAVFEQEPFLTSTFQYSQPNPTFQYPLGLLCHIIVETLVVFLPIVKDRN